MINEINSNSSVPISGQLKTIRKKLNRDLAIKSVATLAALVTGIAVIVFLSSHFLTFGISVVIVASFLFWYHYNQYTFLNGLYSRVAAVVDERLAAVKAAK